MRSRPFITKKRKNKGRVCKALHFQQLLTTFIITGRHGQWYSSNKYNDEADNINKKRKIYRVIINWFYSLQIRFVLQYYRMVCLLFDILKVTSLQLFPNSLYLYHSQIINPLVKKNNFKKSRLADNVFYSLKNLIRGNVVNKFSTT